MAVYTEINDEDLVAFFAAYGIGEVLSCKGIAEGIENSNFALTTTEGPFILTLYEKRVSPDDLPFFLDLMTFLASRGVPCPVPIATADGTVLGSLSDRPAALVSFLPGMSVKRPAPDHCRHVGAALAHLHQCGEGFAGTRRNDLGPEEWRPLLNRIGSDAESVAAQLFMKLDNAVAEVSQSWPTGLPQGVIHADLFPDNVFFRQGQLSGVIDFYFACNDILAYDIAICLNAWCFEPDMSFNVTKARRLLQGYQAVRPLSRDEVYALPTLAQGAALRFLLTRLFDWIHTPPGALVIKKDPIEYVKKLDFHRSVKGAESYGLDG